MFKLNHFIRSYQKVQNMMRRRPLISCRNSVHTMHVKCGLSLEGEVPFYFASV